MIFLSGLPPDLWIPALRHPSGLRLAFKMF